MHKWLMGMIIHLAESGEFNVTVIPNIGSNYIVTTPLSAVVEGMSVFSHLCAHGQFLRE